MFYFLRDPISQQEIAMGRVHCTRPPRVTTRGCGATQKGADIMAEDEHGWTALHKAATCGNRAVVLLLLENGARISKGIDGRTALHFAAEFGNEEIVRIL